MIPVAAHSVAGLVSQDVAMFYYYSLGAGLPGGASDRFARSGRSRIFLNPEVPMEPIQAVDPAPPVSDSEAQVSAPCAGPP
jgi:hypothetical protein